MRLTMVLVAATCCGCYSSAAAAPRCTIKGTESKVRQFPGDLVKSSLTGAEAKKRFVAPRHIQVTVGKVQVVGSTIVLSALLKNRSPKAFSLVVYPYGGKFPYGGDNPFRMGFAPSARKVVKYSGELYPPGPPSPMLIQVPASSCVKFDAIIDLSRYTYKGSPKVTLEWGFHYYRGKHPKGSVQVQLPRQ